MFAFVRPFGFVAFLRAPVASGKSNQTDDDDDDDGGKFIPPALVSGGAGGASKTPVCSFARSQINEN